MHDVLEGEARSQIAYLVYHLVVELGIPLNTVNERVTSFAVGRSDTSNHPGGFPATILSEGKIGQKAAQTWFLVRFLPLIFKDYILDDDQIWLNFLHFARVCQELTALIFNGNDLHRLARMIEE